MDIDAIKGSCYNCGTPGWIASQCRARVKGGGKECGKSTGKGSKSSSKDGRNCLSKGGRPQWARKGKNNMTFDGVCGKCKQQGHKRADCPQRPSRTKAVEAWGGAALAESEIAAICVEDVTSDDSWVMGISAEDSAPRRRGGLPLLDSCSDEHLRMPRGLGQQSRRVVRRHRAHSVARHPRQRDQAARQAQRRVQLRQPRRPGPLCDLLCKVCSRRGA